MPIYQLKERHSIDLTYNDKVWLGNASQISATKFKVVNRFNNDVDYYDSMEDAKQGLLNLYAVTSNMNVDTLIIE